MTRACNTCAWWPPIDPDAKLRPVLNPGWGICKEGPHPIAKAPEDWCGRWRLKEALCGGHDVRRSAEAMGARG